MARPGNKTTRRVCPRDTLDDQEKQQLGQRVCYIGSGHHKRSPGNYGFTHTNPVPTKTLCDEVGLFKREDAEQLLKAGISLGLFSVIREDGTPKYIWSVSANLDVFEAKCDQLGTAHYHGYPLLSSDPTRGYILEVWKERC